MPDILLELVHHVAVFALVGVVAAEYVLLTRTELEGRRLRTLSVLDGAYGGLAGLILLAGAARVVWGDAGWAFYVLNWTFWVKMALFALVAILSIRPTLAILRWRRAAVAVPGYVVPAAEVGAVRGFFHASFGALALIPIFAALMARGVGL